MMASFDIPTIDVSPFLRLEESEEAKKKAMEEIREACVHYGFFLIVNHGIPLELLSRTMDVYKTFFACSDEEKMLVPSENYLKSIRTSSGTYEHFLFGLSSPVSNVFPNNPPHFKQVLEEMVSHYKNLGVVLEGILSECLGLPPDFLGNYRNDRALDALRGLHYFPATEDDYMGKPEHEDPGCITILYQDEVPGLQVHKDGQWITIAQGGQSKRSTPLLVSFVL